MGLLPGQTYMVMSNNGKDIKDIKPIEELGKSSHRKVKVICDICGEEKEIDYSSYCKTMEKHGIYICFDCFNHNPQIVKETVEKRKRTCEEKYGEDNPSKVEEFKEKKKQTTLENYGVEHALQSQEIKNKVKQTMIERYGVEYTMQSEEKIKLSQQTCFKNYGCLHPLQNENILRKARETAFDNGSRIKDSKQQKNIYDLLSFNYPEATLEYNKAEGKFDLDICFILNDILIDIECDGYYYHYMIKEDQPHKDRIRDEIIKRENYKIFRIVYKEKIPNEDEIIKGIETLINTDKKFIRIISEDCKQYFE